MLQHRVITNRRLLRSVTGFSRDEFERLLPSFAKAYEADAKDRQKRQTRQRRPGGGRRGHLPTLRAKLLFILVYVHLYPIQEVQGVLFGMSQSQASDWALRLLPILQAALGHEVALPARPPTTLEHVQQHCPGLVFLLDATERPIQRPGQDERQKRYYSGKKKRHTVKNTIITDVKGQRIVFLGATVCGSIHDKKQAEADDPPFPPDSEAVVDAGYQGYAPAGVSVISPLKKYKGRELSAEAKAVNTALAKHRIYVEHAIGGMKHKRIVSDIFRNTREGLLDTAIAVAAGLYNLTNQYRGRGISLAA